MTTSTPKRLGPGPRRATLEAFERAIDREPHNLQQRPDLLWQQLYNRLQWEHGRAPLESGGAVMGHTERRDDEGAGKRSLNTARRQVQ
jgi:hypothetical protein